MSDRELSVLIELDAESRCLGTLRSLAQQSVVRERIEIIGVCSGVVAVAVPEPVRAQVDWLLCNSVRESSDLHLGFNRAARMATGRIVVRCDARAELPLGFLDCLLSSFSVDGGARQPVVTLQGGDGQGTKLALALHRQDVQLVLAAGRADMPLEDVAWLMVESGAQHLRLDAGAAATPAAALDWRDIPVFIVNRNRHEAMVRLIDWLRAGGTRRIVILDNVSTYPPLLQYYDALPEGVRVMRLPQNHGPYVLWQQRVHEVLDKPYVVTDSDIVPADFCPADLVGKLHETLLRYPDAGKVGPALRIDNLPDGYADADTVRKWESQFWEHPVAPGVFAAPIDTTFALYPARSGFSINNRALRLGRPYVVEHTPWYAVEGQISDEEQYYRSHASKNFSNWSVRGKQSSTYRSERVQRFDQRALVLNVDPTGEHIPGWLNIGHEIQLDAQGRLPLADGTLDGVRLNDALHGLPEVAPLFGELRRSARSGAKMQLRMAVAAGEDWQRTRWAQQLPAAAAQAGWDLQEVRLVTDRESVARRLREQGAALGTPPVQTVLVTLTALPRGSTAVARLPVPVLIGDDRLAPHFVPARSK